MIQKPHEFKPEPGVSAVICCFNSAQVITGTVKALSEQNVPAELGYEVILVDNNCTDNTVHLAIEAWENCDYPLIIVKESRPGLIFARKTGVKRARYEILLFVDDDNILNPDWVFKLNQLFKKMPEVGIIGGYNEALIQGRKPFWFDRYQFVYACGPRAEKSGKNSFFMFGAGLSFRTEVIRSVLFSSLPTFLIGRTKNILARGEDSEMALRCRLMGWDFYYDSSLRLKHCLVPERLCWEYVCQARKGGAVANMILKIYWNLLSKKTIWNYSRWILTVIREWVAYLITHWKCVFQIKKKGSEVSFHFNRLLGMTVGLLVFWRTYHSIQKKIINHFMNIRNQT